MKEDNIKKKIALPWMRIGSDAGSMTPEGKFLESNTHPRAYGNFARLLGKYVRDEKVISLEEAIKKLTYNPAKTLKIKNRGLLKKGYYADIVIFDKDKIKDFSTFSNSHQFSTGVIHVFVNGTQVLVKLTLIQKALDKKRDLNTSGYISGYRGSPLGIYD